MLDRFGLLQYYMYSIVLWKVEMVNWKMVFVLYFIVCVRVYVFMGWLKDNGHEQTKTR